MNSNLLQITPDVAITATVVMAVIMLMTILYVTVMQFRNKRFFKSATLQEKNNRGYVYYYPYDNELRVSAIEIKSAKGPYVHYLGEL